MTDKQLRERLEEVLEGHASKMLGQMPHWTGPMPSNGNVGVAIRIALRRLDAARKALEPVAGLDTRHMDGNGDDYPIFGLNETLLTLGDIRKARAALARLEGFP